MKYKTVAIPYALSVRFDAIQRYFGFRSFSEFVIDIVRDGVSTLETEHEHHEFEKKEKGEHE